MRQLATLVSRLRPGAPDGQLLLRIVSDPALRKTLTVHRKVSGQGICPGVLIECGWVKSVRIDTFLGELTPGDADLERDIVRHAGRMGSEVEDRLSVGNLPVSRKNGCILGENRSGFARIYAI